MSCNASSSSSAMLARSFFSKPGSLSDLREIGCKMIWPVHISPLYCANGKTIGLKIVKIYPRPSHFSLRFLKSDRLLDKNHLCPLLVAISVLTPPLLPRPASPIRFFTILPPRSASISLRTISSTAAHNALSVSSVFRIQRQKWRVLNTRSIPKVCH